MTRQRRPGYTGWWLQTDAGLIPDPGGPLPRRVEMGVRRWSPPPEHPEQQEGGCTNGHAPQQMVDNGKRRWCRACGRDRMAEAAAKRKGEAA